MGGLSRIATLTGALALAIGSVAGAQIYPTVTLSSFNPVTFTYQYTVSQPANATYQLGQLMLDTEVLLPTWAMSGPVVGGNDQNWYSGSFHRTATKDSIFWIALNDAQEVPANTAWTGVFTVVAPGTMPVPGFALTKDTIISSQNVSSVQVPGPVPEPASVLALSGALLGVPIYFRKRRS